MALQHRQSRISGNEAHLFLFHCNPPSKQSAPDKARSKPLHTHLSICSSLCSHNNTGSLPSKSLERGRPRHARFFEPRPVARVHREASVHFRVGPVSLCPRYRIGLAFSSLRCGFCSARIEVAADADAAATPAASTNTEHCSHFHSHRVLLPYDFSEFSNECATPADVQLTYQATFNFLANVCVCVCVRSDSKPLGKLC
ncbi:hypothetical protein Baya_6898 [Bagarius yarrelli]|uniref:Uncharacterized protein n=1 Tax=Bagarius yarrelli TaxID=175774 RepID=A0A556U379_BAGYA|nr:hypothetical protein Baya_6898 [Bagarius yarrelli]